MTHTQQKWATSDRKPTAPHYQGQIYDEATGQTVAISYNDEGGHHAVLIAAAPALYEALKACERALECRDVEAEEHAAKEARRVLRLAEGRG